MSCDKIAIKGISNPSKRGTFLYGFIYTKHLVNVGAYYKILKTIFETVDFMPLLVK